jgi:transcriptional regulator with XRE-family HTH domain
MKAHSFTIVASGLDPASDALEDGLYEAGCDDATVSVVRGRILLDFDREAKNLVHAIASAVADVERAGARIERIEPDALVTVSDIAERAGLSRQAVSLFARGERGQGFPPPVAKVSSDAPLWDWAEVAAWLHRRGKVPTGTVVEAHLLGWANRWSAGRREGERTEEMA